MELKGAARGWIFLPLVSLSEQTLPHALKHGGGVPLQEALKVMKNLLRRGAADFVCMLRRMSIELVGWACEDWPSLVCAEASCNPATAKA